MPGHRAAGHIIVRAVSRFQTIPIHIIGVNPVIVPALIQILQRIGNCVFVFRIAAFTILSIVPGSLLQRQLNRTDGEIAAVIDSTLTCLRLGIDIDRLELGLGLRLSIIQIDFCNIPICTTQVIYRQHACRNGSRITLTIHTVINGNTTNIIGINNTYGIQNMPIRHTVIRIPMIRRRTSGRFSAVITHINGLNLDILGTCTRAVSQIGLNGIKLHDVKLGVIHIRQCRGAHQAQAHDHGHQHGQQPLAFPCQHHSFSSQISLAENGIRGGRTGLAVLAALAS